MFLFLERSKSKKSFVASTWLALEMPRVSISEAVVVDGGLTPPPSTFYPGRKCYMVTVTFGKVEHFGFGPSPSIARAAAIRSTLERELSKH